MWNIDDCNWSDDPPLLHDRDISTRIYFPGTNGVCKTKTGSLPSKCPVDLRAGNLCKLCRLYSRQRRFCYRRLRHGLSSFKEIGLKERSACEIAPSRLKSKRLNSKLPPPSSKPMRFAS